MMMTWNSMVENYPNMWVVIKNPVMDGPDVIKGEVITAKSDDEICDYEDSHDNEGLIFRRTTDDEWNGTIRTDFIIRTV